jgi:hypothetical protein
MKKFSTSIISILLLTTNVMADENFTNDIAIGIKASTLGLGVEAIKPINAIDFRLGINKASYAGNKTIDSVDYSADLNAQTISLLADWHPANNSFFVSGGMMANNNKFDLSAAATSNKSINIGDTIVNTGKVDSTISFDGASPYIGIGYRQPIASSKGLSLTSELGVLYQGSPNISIKVSPQNLVSQPDIDKEIDNIRKDIDPIKYWPIASLGISYSF